MKGYSPVRVEILNQTTGKYETLTLDSDMLGPQKTSIFLSIFPNETAAYFVITAPPILAISAPPIKP